MDALADVADDHDWLDPRVRHRAVEHIVREVLVDFLLGDRTSRPPSFNRSSNTTG
jgi:hypothetical protein